MHTIDTMMGHFNQVSAKYIAEFGVALSNGDWQEMRSIRDRVSGLAVTASVTNLVNSSREGLRGFVERLEREFPPEALKMIFGGVALGVGGAVLYEAAGLAAAIGVSIFAVEMIAVVLLLWGLSLALPAIWQRALTRIDDFKSQLKSE